MQATNSSTHPKPVVVSTKVDLRQAATGVLAGLSECNPVLEEFRKASKRPYSRFNLTYGSQSSSPALVPHLNLLLSACKVLRLRAVAELTLGQTDAAFDDVCLTFDLADAIRNEPLVMSYLTRISELFQTIWPIAEGLSRHQWSEAQLKAFQNRLQQLNLCGDARHALAAERVLSGIIPIDRLRRSANRGPMLDRLYVLPDGPQGKNIRVLASVIPRGWFYLEQLNFARLYEEYVLPTIDAAHNEITPTADRRLTAQFEIGPGHSDLHWFLRHELILHGIVRNIWRNMWQADWVASVQAGLNSATLACALERYRLAHGQFPDSLNALVPRFIEKVPHDIINGKPLHYRRTQDGQFILYSVGWNETDDGGTVGRHLNTDDLV
ncbi:MAG: hypothetical protein M1608_09865, partial [Candidatus Omnitrophica bacterium]|nr:hypothetical protein [Candidatus Omnitrophota bacterium]